MKADDQLDLQLDTDAGGQDVELEGQEGQQDDQQGQQGSAEAQGQQEQGSEHAQELEAVSEAVQRRISKLTARMREAERREQAAIEYARGLQSTAQQLQQKLTQTDYSRLNEAKTRMETQAATLKQIIRKAREEGDIDTETEAQERLTGLMMEQRQVAAYLQQAPAQQAAQQEQQQAYQPPQQPQQAYQQPQQPVRQAPKVSPKAEDWAAKNTWFGQDRVMTYAAWGIHQTLVEQEGIDPESDEYYTELDNRLRNEFPQRFKTENRQQRSAPAVAPAARASGVSSARKTVRLSPSQVAIAKKLGVPLEEYAKYVKD
jgi:hypothetical protein